jgi:hypothetical protein
MAGRRRILSKLLIWAELKILQFHLDINNNIDLLIKLVN